jgi:hypothetical protein
MVLFATLSINDVLSDVMLNVVMLSVIMLSVIMLSVIMLSVIMLSVIVLNVVMLNVVAPTEENYYLKIFLHQEMDMTSAVIYYSVC